MNFQLEFGLLTPLYCTIALLMNCDAVKQCIVHSLVY